MIPKGPAKIEVGVDQRGSRAFTILCDPRREWAKSNPGKMPPPGLNLDPVAIGFTHDAEVAYWMANLDELKSKLSGMAQVIQANMGSPMEAIAKVQDSIGWIMNLVSTSESEALKIDAAAKIKARELLEARKKRG